MGLNLLMLGKLLVVTFIFANSECLADIYRYVDQNGVECFTDAPQPTHRGATRIMKEAHGREKRASGSERAVKPASAPSPSSTLPVRGVVSSLVGMRHDPIDGLLRHHNGIDIAVPEGTPVRPVFPGVVSYSGYRAGYGNMIIIAHDDGMVTVYAHNSSCLVRQGEMVETGSTIALSGSTGRSTGPHLHFEAWKDGVNITATFLSGISGNGSAATALLRHESRIRRAVLADGSLLFTNLP